MSRPPLKTESLGTLLRFLRTASASDGGRRGQQLGPLGPHVDILLQPIEGAAHMNLAAVIHSDPEILGGTPVFVGTRVPAQTLFDYLEGGDSLDEFLDQFPTVSRVQAVAALELAKESVLTSARPA